MLCETSAVFSGLLSRSLHLDFLWLSLEIAVPDMIALVISLVNVHWKLNFNLKCFMFPFATYFIQTERIAGWDYLTYESPMDHSILPLGRNLKKPGSFLSSCKPFPPWPFTARDRFQKTGN